MSDIVKKYYEDMSDREIMNSKRIKNIAEDEINQTITIFEEEYPELSKEFKIVFIPKTIDEVLSSINEISTNGRNYYRSIRNNILSSKTNPNKFIISFIERLKDRKCS